MTSQKAGARHSAADARKLQHVHDSAVELGAVCDAPKAKTIVAPSVKSTDLTALCRAVRAAIGRACSLANDSGSLDGDGDYDWVDVTHIYTDYAIARNGLEYRMIPYSIAGDDVQVPPASEWVVVEPTWTPVQNVEADDTMTSSPFETVKALPDGKVAGYLVRFGGKDLSQEFFTKNTYFGAHNGDGVDTLFHHGIPVAKGLEHLADRILPPLKTTVDDIGIFAEVVLDMADEYQQIIYQMAQKGKLGWSSGAPSHMVKRLDTGEITRWVISEGSLTPQPCEPRNTVSPLKSLPQVETPSELQGFAQASGEDATQADSTQQPTPPKITLIIRRS